MRPPYLQTLMDDETNITNKNFLEDCIKNKTPVTIQRKYLEGTAGTIIWIWKKCLLELS